MAEVTGGFSKSPESRMEQLQGSVTSCINCPNVYKSCQKMISLEKLEILAPLQKNVGAN